MDREIADPTSDTNEFLIGGHGSVDQHHRCRRAAVLLKEPSPQVQEHHGEILVDDHASTQPIDQEGAVLIARQHGPAPVGEL
jgi:hypothetical protein